MKLLIICTSILMIIGCEKIKEKSYEDGLENCERQIREQMFENPERIGYSHRPECIVGSQLPEFKGETMDGKLINEENLKGKLSIINFWFITCPPCVAEIPGFNKIVESYGQEQINYIAIGKDKRSDIEEFLEDHPWHFEQMLNGDELIKSNFKFKWSFPTTFIVNKEGKIIYSESGGKSDSTAIEAIQKKLIPVIERELK